MRSMAGLRLPAATAGTVSSNDGLATEATREATATGNVSSNYLEQKRAAVAADTLT